MRVGFNYPYPWNAYGVYLGSGKPWGSNPALDRWPALVRDNLARLFDAGIDCVRMFLFCNAYNLDEEPAELHPKAIEQLTALYQSCAELGMQLIPSFVDFKAWGGPALSAVGVSNGCGGRQRFISEAALREAVLERVLRPCLVAALPYKSSIYAWEVQNEPIWNLLPGLPLSVTGRCRLGYRSMRSFLRAALALIESEPFRFPSTVGHRFASDLALLPTGTERQFHFYPVRRLGRYWLDRTLPDHASTRAFLGEIGSLGRTPAGHYPHGDPWRELGGRDAHDARGRVFARLELAHSKGYPLALLWPDRKDEPVRATDPLKLTPEALRGVQDFLRRSPTTRWSNS